MNITLREQAPGKWRLRIERGRDADGNRTFSYETVTGALEDAQRRRFEILAGYKEGTWLAPDKVILKSFLLGWIEERHAGNHISKSTAGTYRVIAEAYIFPTLGGLKVQKIEGAEIQGLYTALSTRNGLSPSTVRLVHAILTGLFTHARKRKIIVVNPMEEVTQPRLLRNRKPKALDARQIERLLAALAGHWLEPIVLVGLGCGLRRGEICGLRWRDIDFERNRFLINGQVIRQRDNAKEYTAPKSEGSRRRVSFPISIGDVLRTMRTKALMSSMAAGFGGAIDDAYVFFSRGGSGMHPLNPATLTITFSTLCNKIGLSGFTFHGTRHTHITSLLKQVGKQGAKLVSERVGHASIAFTLGAYQTVFEEDDHELADLAEGILSPKRSKELK